MDSEFWVRESIRDRIVEDDYEVGDQLGRYGHISFYYSRNNYFKLLLFSFKRNFKRRPDMQASFS